MANLAQILTDSAGPHAERPAILAGDQVHQLRRAG